MGPPAERPRWPLVEQARASLADLPAANVDLPVIRESIATTQDLDALGHRVEAQISGLRAEMAHLRADLRKDVGTDVATLAGEVRREIVDGQRLLLFAMLGAMFTLSGLVWAVVTLAQ